MAHREELYVNQFITQAGKRVATSGTAAPTAGTYAVGDTVYNSAPTAGGVFAWVCTTAGAPGTWKAVAISA
jgi:hypothetical protein